MKAYLLIDFGSTYTKLTVVDIEQLEIIATSKAITTVETNIMDGFYKAYEQLDYDRSHYKIVKRLACSSAAGGLKMVTIGLVPELTAEAAKRAALGAGARVLKTFCYELSLDEIEEMKQMAVDIILLSGGTDGGNKKTIITNAEKIAEHFPDKPIIVAGNKCAYDEIKMIFKDRVMNYVMTDNVMPRLNEIHVDSVREEIRSLFMSNIIKSKGMDVAMEFIDGILMPTPLAVMKAAEVLARGTNKYKGLGDLMIVDIGGATTDVHSLSNGLPTKAGINLKGLQEPYGKRTVEGDLGMRYSAVSLYEASGERMIAEYLNSDVDIYDSCYKRQNEVMFVPQDEEEALFDEAIAKVATKLAVERHVGKIEIVYTPIGEVYNQIGKDLMDLKILIGTGGILVHSSNNQAILKEALHKPEDATLLKPKNPKILIDKHYILSAMGLLSMECPDQAFKIIEKYIMM